MGHARNALIAFAGFGLATVIGFAVIGGSKDMERFAILPEPTMSGLRDGSYQTDAEAMKGHCDALFDGMSWEEVQTLFTTEEVQHKFEGEDSVMFFPRKVILPVVSSYSCAVVILFEEGRFLRTDRVEMCGLDAL